MAINDLYSEYSNTNLKLKYHCTVTVNGIVVGRGVGPNKK
jgi:hypothetical protein